MEEHLCLLIMLLCFSGGACGIKEFPGILGGSALLAGGPTQLQNHKIEWKLQNGILIASLSPGSSIAYNDTCTGRCELFQNATLRMDNLKSSDAQYYVLTIYDIGASSAILETIELKLYRHVTTPTLRIHEPKEPVSGGPLTLYCDAGDQESLTYSFYYIGQPIDCNTSPITCREYSPYLNFNPVTQSDNGPYRCDIHNPVSSTSSHNLHLSVSVPVSGVAIRRSPTNPVNAEKDNVWLICDASGTSLEYSFQLNGSALPANPRYQLNHNSIFINPVTRSDQGYFTCTASSHINSVTSEHTTLNWYPVGRVSCGAQRLNNKVGLTCSWPGGYPSATVALVYSNYIKSNPDKVTQDIHPNQFGKVLTCSGTYMGSSESCALAIDTPQSDTFKNNSAIKAFHKQVVVITIHLKTTYMVNHKDGPKASTPQIFPAKFTWHHKFVSSSPIKTDSRYDVYTSNYTTQLVIRSYVRYLGGTYICLAENDMGSTYFVVKINGHGSSLNQGAGFVYQFLIVISIIIGINSSL